MRIVIKPLGAFIIALAVVSLALLAFRGRRSSAPAAGAATAAAAGQPVNLAKPTGDPAHWVTGFTNGGAASLAAGEDGALKVTIQHATGTDWHLQICQSGLTFRDGETVSVRFRGRSDAARTLKVWAATDSGDFHAIWSNWGEAVALTPEWRDYSYHFVAQKPVPGHSTAPVFAFGNNKEGTFYLKDVVVEVRR